MLCWLRCFSALLRRSPRHCWARFIRSSWPGCSTRGPALASPSCRYFVSPSLRQSRLRGRHAANGGGLLSAIGFGGIVGPVLLLLGLATTSASTTSLLLNLESAFTALLAWFLFRENFDKRIAFGMAVIFAGGGCTFGGAGEPWRAIGGRTAHRGGLPLLGHRQQSDAQGLDERRDSDRGLKGGHRRRGQPLPRAEAWGLPSPNSA